MGEHLKNYPRDKKGHVKKPKDPVGGSLANLSFVKDRAKKQDLMNDLKNNKNQDSI